MKQDLITIGIACYNAEPTIRQAIESAITQDWPNIEVLIVDDASTDASAQIAAEMAIHDSRIRLISMDKNVGVGAVRNRIVNEARGQWITFFDDDDTSAPKRVRLQRQRIIEYENGARNSLVLCFASGSRTYPNGYTLTIEAIGSKPEIPVGNEIVDYLLFNHRNKGVFYGRGTPASALMARKKTILKAGSFDKRFRRVEDSELAIRVALLGGAFVGCPENLYFQTATLGSDKSPTQNYKYESQIIDKQKAYLKDRNRYGYAKRWFRFRYYFFDKQLVRAFWALFLAWLADPIQTTNHILRSAPKRLKHERGIQDSME